MKHLHQALLCLSLLATPALFQPALAQSVDPGCPALMTASGLSWETQSQGQFLLCRAVDGQGQPVFNVMYTASEPDIQLLRSHRAEKARFGNNEILWHRVDVAGDTSPDIPFRRITKVRLQRGLHAQLWINASDEQQLQQLIAVIGQLQPANPQLAGAP